MIEVPISVISLYKCPFYCHLQFITGFRVGLMICRPPLVDAILSLIQYYLHK